MKTKQILLVLVSLVGVACSSSNNNGSSNVGGGPTDGSDADLYRKHRMVAPPPSSPDMSLGGTSPDLSTGSGTPDMSVASSTPDLGIVTMHDLSVMPTPDLGMVLMHDLSVMSTPDLGMVSPPDLSMVSSTGVPSVSGVDPAIGPMGTALTVSGSGFQTGDSVRFSTAGTVITLATVSLASGAIVAMMPTSGVPLGAGTVTVVRNGQSSTGAPFTVTGGKVWWIAPNGSDSAPGTQAQPMQNIAAAANVMSPGDLAFVRGGTYNVQNVETGSGAPGAPLTFVGYPGETPLFTQTLYIEGGYVTIDHLTFTNYIEYDIGLDIWSTAHDVTVSNCEVYGTKGQGVIVTGSHNLFVHNSIHDNGMHFNKDHGIYVEGGYNTFRYNRIYNNWDYGIQFYSGYTTITGGNDIVENNLIYHNGYGAHSLGYTSTAGIILSWRHPNETVRNNVLCDNADYGIFVELEPGRQLSGNVTCFNHSGGYRVDPDASSTTLSGNISYMDSGWVLRASSGTTSDGATYWNGGAAPLLQWNGSDYSFAGFQSVSGQDMHSKIADPKLVNVPSSGFDWTKMSTYNFCNTVNPALCNLN